MGEYAQKLQDGGPIIWILAALSLFSLTLIVVKIVQLRGVTGGEGTRQKAIETWANGDRHAAIKMVIAGNAPADLLTSAAMEGLQSGTEKGLLDANLQWRGNAEIAEMSRHIRMLELIAMISPLLGLLGTVLGMIQSFQELALAQGAANASLLAAGIWQALLTTAAGLIVAIPAAVAASLLAEKVDRAATAIETSVGMLFSAHKGT